MGIRFTCPNGDKLNVKSHLAGQRCVCPECGVRLLVPRKSTRESARPKTTQDSSQPLSPQPEESESAHTGVSSPFDSPFDNRAGTAPPPIKSVPIPSQAGPKTVPTSNTGKRGADSTTPTTERRADLTTQRTKRLNRKARAQRKLWSVLLLIGAIFGLGTVLLLLLATNR